MRDPEQQPSYVEAGRNWFWQMDPYDQQQYRENRQRALEEPDFDLFEHRPLNMPKRDIGRYVLSHSIPVPLVRSQDEWEHVFDERKGMLRSEMPQDYNGYAGVLHSKVLAGKDWYNYDFRHGNDAPEDIPLVSVPIFGSRNVESKLQSVLIPAMRAGQVHPGQYMKYLGTDYGNSFTLGHAIDKGVPMARLMSDIEVLASASFWRYVPGQNIRVFRDPVKPGHYYMRGNSANHAFEVTPDDVDLPRIFRRDGHYDPPRTPEEGYVFPTKRVIDLYEKIRTLPYFDTSQLPVMEMQYGDDGVLYFLQYLKTGNTLHEGKKFSVPSKALPIAGQVRGETPLEGVRHRLYIDPHHWAKRIAGHSVYIDAHHARASSLFVQYLCMKAGVMLTNGYLSFKNNHFDDSLLHRPGVSIATWLGHNENKELNERIEGAAQPFRTVWEPAYEDLKYIEATIWANGYEAGIESDWQQRSEPLS